MCKKYMKQKTNSDCSPVAIVNSLIWGGMGNWKARNLYTILKDNWCQVDEDGTDDSNVTNSLRFLNKRYNIFRSITRVANIKFDNVVDKLDSSYGLLLGHLEVWENNPEWHHSFWIKSGCGMYVGINANQKSIEYLTNEEYFQIICQTGEWDSEQKRWAIPSGWLIRRREK